MKSLRQIRNSKMIKELFFENIGTLIWLEKNLVKKFI